MNTHTHTQQESVLCENLGFKLCSTALDDVFVLERPKHSDHRGVFGKTYNEKVFKEFNLATNFKESVFSISQKNVLRGMHYQQYPFGHAKLVSVLEGEILDVIFGIGGMLNTRNRGKYFSAILSDENRKTLFIPDGYAHGFLCLSDRAVVSYQTTSVYNAEADRAIHWDSFGYEWPINNPILSDKDRQAQRFDVLKEIRT